MAKRHHCIICNKMFFETEMRSSPVRAWFGGWKGRTVPGNWTCECCYKQEQIKNQIKNDLK